MLSRLLRGCIALAFTASVRAVLRFHRLVVALFVDLMNDIKHERVPGCARYIICPIAERLNQACLVQPRHTIVQIKLTERTLTSYFASLLAPTLPTRRLLKRNGESKIVVHRRLNVLSTLRTSSNVYQHTYQVTGIYLVMFSGR